MSQYPSQQVTSGICTLHNTIFSISFSTISGAQKPGHVHSPVERHSHTVSLNIEDMSAHDLNPYLMKGAFMSLVLVEGRGI